MSEVAYTQSLNEEVTSIKLDERLQLRYAALFARDRDQRELGEHQQVVKMIRRKRQSMDASAMAEMFDISEADCNRVLEALDTHPDWDDEQIAGFVRWDA